MQQDNLTTETKQKWVSKEYLTRYLPSNVNTLLYALFVLTYLVCAVIRFAHTGGISMFSILLPYISVYAGIHNIAPLLSWKKTGVGEQN